MDNKGSNGLSSPVNSLTPPAYGDTVQISRQHGSSARGQQGVVWGFAVDGKARVRIRAGHFAHVEAEYLTVVRRRGGSGNGNGQKEGDS